MKSIGISITSLMIILSLFIAISTGDDITRPDGYRQWRHIKSMVIKEGHPLFEPFGGIHHIYANKKALRGYEKGKFPVGSIIVFELFEAIDKDNAITEGNRKFIGVMQKVSDKPDTSGWLYEVFAGKDLKKKGVNGARDCHGCHSKASKTEYVFSTTNGPIKK